MGTRNYRELIAWQKAIDLVESVYRATRTWPREELYGLTNQVRRAVISVPANIAEGQGRSSVKEFMQFVSIANGSLHEVETHLLISHRLGYIDEASCEHLMYHTAEVGRLLNGLMRSFRSPSTTPPITDN